MVELRKGTLYQARYGAQYKQLTLLVHWNGKMAAVRTFAPNKQFWRPTHAMPISQLVEFADLENRRVRNAITYGDAHFLSVLVQVKIKKPPPPEDPAAKADAEWQCFARLYPNKTRPEAARAQWVKLSDDDKQAALAAAASIAEIYNQVPENMRTRQTSAAIFLRYKQWPILFERKAK